MTSPDGFFLAGPAGDPAYVNVRDSPNLADARAFTESLWPSYRHLADPHFRSDARNHFLERFWEMYLACSLLSRGFDLLRAGSEGPEFFFLNKGRRVWVEAVAPGPGLGPDRVLETRAGERYTVPADKIILRFTGAFRAKQRKLASDIQKGIVAPDDQVLLAINSRGIPHAPYGAELPYIVKALFPIGAYALNIDTRTREITDRVHQYRPEVQKTNLSPVATTALLEAESAPFSAVLHSAVDCDNRPRLLGADFLVLHNPSASRKLPSDVFSWCRQLEYTDDALHELPAQGSDPLQRTAFGSR